MSEASIAQLTGHYGRWQGLRWVPFGVAALVAAILVGLTPSNPAFLPTALLGMGAMSLAEARVNRYYEGAFGHVRDPRNRRLWLGALRYGALVPAVAAGMADLQLHPPVLLTGWTVAGAYLVFWSVTGRGRPHWPVLALVLLFVSFAPAAGVVSAGRQGVVTVLVVTAVTEFIGGALDHRTLIARVNEVYRGLRQ